MSIRIGSPDVGMPAASGFGVNTGVTRAERRDAVLSTDRCNGSAPSRRDRLRASGTRRGRRCDASAGSRRCPCRASRPSPSAASSARSVSHGPGSRCPSHVCATVARVDDRRLARLRHPPLRELVEITAQQRQPVRRVPHQVAVDQHGGDIGAMSSRTPIAQQQLDRVRAERRGIVARGGSVARASAGGARRASAEVEGMTT